MDRPCFFASCRLVGAALLTTVVLSSVVLSSGCRSTHSEVPPGKPYARTGEAPPTVGFSSQPHPANAGSMPASVNIGPGGMPDDRLAGGQPQFGTPTPGSKGVAMPTGNRYGPPGTTGLDPTAGASPSDIADSLMDSGKSVSKALADDPKLNKASAMSPQ
jgi:hypothetical protein